MIRCDITYIDAWYTYLPISTNLCQTSKGFPRNSLSIAAPLYTKDVETEESDEEETRGLRISLRFPPPPVRVERKLRKAKHSTSPPLRNVKNMRRYNSSMFAFQVFSRWDVLCLDTHLRSIRFRSVSKHTASNAEQRWSLNHHYSILSSSYVGPNDIMWKLCSTFVHAHAPLHLSRPRLSLTQLLSIHRRSLLPHSIAAAERSSLRHIMPPPPCLLIPTVLCCLSLGTLPS